MTHLLRRTIVKYSICLVACLFALFVGCNKQGNQPGTPGAQDSTAASVAADSAAIVPKVLTDSTKVQLGFRFRPGDFMHYKEITRTISEGKFNGFPSSAKDEI